MSATVLTTTTKSSREILLESNYGFIQETVLFYLAAFTFALLMPLALKYLPPSHSSYSLPMHLAASLILGIIFIMILDSYIKKKLRHEIKLLTRTAKKFAKGEIAGPLPAWNDEAMDVLAGTIAQTIQGLQNRINSSLREKGKLSIILNHMQEGVVGVDENRRILIHNPSASQILDCAHNGTGKSLIEFTHNPEIDEAMRLAIEGQKNISREIEINYPEKKIFKISAIGTGAESSGICGILVLHDITAFKNLERARKEFVANASHELRTPLTSIKGFIETLLGGAAKDPAQSEHFLKIMHSDAERLTRLVEDLLDLSSIESRKIPLKVTPFRIQDEIRNTLQAMEPGLKRKNITVSADLDESIPPVQADHDKIHQVLVNLLDNAIKFSRQGGHISAQAFHLGGMLQVTIRDNGVGIPENMVPRIFERFFRVDKARSRDEGGTGLGLAIAKHIIEAHGGQIFCESRLGEGSAFSFAIPAAGPRPRE